MERVLGLHAAGLNASQISRELGIPRSTIHSWIKPRYVRKTRPEAESRRACFRCFGGEVGPDYVYLLGLYLGDGFICAHPRGVWRLRIFQDRRYHGLINECRLAMSVVSTTRVLLVRGNGCIEITAYWKHWIHVFPQHGPGMKWLRRITLEAWQQALVERYPAQLV